MKILFKKSQIKLKSLKKIKFFQEDTKDLIKLSI